MWSHDIKSLYLYNIKDNVLSKLRNVPSNTKIISILAKTQMLLSECHDGNHNLMIVDILFPSIIIPISLPEKILKYNFSKTKTLLESKIICGSCFSDIVILK